MSTWGILGIILGVGLLLLFYGVAIYNQLVALRNRLENAFAQIEVLNDGFKTTIAELDTSLQVIIPELPEINIEQAANRFVPPVVVEEIDSSETGMISMDDLIATATILPPPQIINEPAPQDPDIEVEQRPFITVEVPATFNGGDLIEFNKWVSQNLKYPQIAIENQISAAFTYSLW
jgi:hypothetical protein